MASGATTLGIRFEVWQMRQKFSDAAAKGHLVVDIEGRLGVMRPGMIGGTILEACWCNISLHVAVGETPCYIHSQIPRQRPGTEKFGDKITPRQLIHLFRYELVLHPTVPLSLHEETKPKWLRSGDWSRNASTSRLCNSL